MWKLTKVLSAKILRIFLFCRRYRGFDFSVLLHPTLTRGATCFSRIRGLAKAFRCFVVWMAANAAKACSPTCQCGVQQHIKIRAAIAATEKIQISVKIAIFLACSLVLTECKVGPNYHTPTTPIPLEYHEDQPDVTIALNDEDFSHWWMLFDDPFLDSLLEEALYGSFDYRIALEKICQARAEFRIQFAQILPDFVGDFQASRFRSSQSFASATTTPIIPVPNNLPNIGTATLSPIRNFFQIGLDMIWQIDLFGQLRRSADAAYNLWEASDENARAVKITVLSEVATTYVNITAIQKKKELARTVVELDMEILDLTKALFEAGLGNELDVQTAITTLQFDKSNLLVFDTSWKIAIYSLGTLLGGDPESIIEDFQIARSIPKADGRIPVGLPSDLLRRRPDIRSAERNLAAATEQIGVAIAELFPKLSLTGSSSSFAANPLQGANFGYTSDTLNKLFNKASRIWGIGGLVTFPIFDFGKRWAGVDAQRSIEQQVYLNYQKTVTLALQEVEQALASYFNNELRVEELTVESASYKRLMDLTSVQFSAGLINFTQVMQARQAWINAQYALIDSQQAFTVDLINIYKALGGDW